MSDGPGNSATRRPSDVDVALAPESGTDRDLLHRFVEHREESAFTALVERHGPMVLDVCRRVLRDSHEAEDACQATFLVLARKSGTLRQPELLANWLYGVAYRSAKKAQRQRVRYCAHAMRSASMQATDATADIVWKDLRPVLDEELERLPAKYRAAVVLCYLEGLKVEEAAQQLNCPRGTILSRLARARQRLSSRLAMRGLALSTGFLGLLLTRKAMASTSLPTAFVECTVKAACRFAGPKAASSVRIDERANHIAQGVLLSMLLAKLKFAAVCLLVTGVVLIGTATAVRLALAAGFGKAVVQAGAEDTPAEDPLPKKDEERIQGAWREVGFENAQGKAPLDAIKGYRWVIEGDGFKMVDDKLGAMDVKFSLHLDPDANPKAIDIAANGAPCWVGIYELNEDTLRICTAEAGAPRPRDFVPGGVGGKMVWSFKREQLNKDASLPKKP
jgi:RNA polymerase sigma factor (sigma-70 family)